MRVTAPSYPWSRRASAVFAPASPPPTITTLRTVSVMTSSSYSREGEELLAGAGVVPQRAEQRRGHGGGSRSAHATHRHAGVLGLDDHADAGGGEVLLQPI